VFIRNVLVGLMGASLVGLVGAAIEGRAGWVYAATAAFMTVGVALALYTALIATRPGGTLKAAGFRPTRRPRTWRAIVDDVPVEAVLRDDAVHFRPAGLPEGLSLLPGASPSRGTGDPAFDAVVQCRGRSAEIAALGPIIRARLMPLIALGARVQHGVLSVPASGSAEVMAAASEAAANLAQIHADLRRALLARAAQDTPHLGLPAVLALAAGWPDDAATQAHLDTLLQHSDAALRLAAAEASRSTATTVLDALSADVTLPIELRVRAFTARIGAASSAEREVRLARSLDAPVFRGATLALAIKHGVSLPLDSLIGLAQSGGTDGAAATTGLQMHAEAAEPALLALTDHVEAAVRSAALEALGRVGTMASVAHLRGDDDAAAASALARIRLRVGD
jgi:hypothetical protein